MITITGTGDDTYQIRDHDGVTIGVVDGHRVRFHGLPHPAACIAAAAAAWPRLQRTLRRQLGRRAHDVRVEELRLMHDGAHEWITDGTQPVARLIRPRADDVPQHFALEFVLPSYANEGVRITTAQTLALAVLPLLAAEPERRLADAVVHAGGGYAASEAGVNAS